MILSTLLTVTALTLAQSPCDVDAAAARDAKPIANVAPALVKQSPLPEKWWKGLRAVDVTEALEVDERVVRFTLIGDKLPPPTRLSLALPAPWNGAVDVTAREGPHANANANAKFCSRVELVLFDKELRRATLEALPVDVSVSFARKGGPVAPGIAAGQKKRTLPQERIVLAPGTLDVVVEGSEPTRLWVGAGPPAEEALLADGADTYMKFLAALGDVVVDDIRKNPSRDAQRVLFAEAAAAWREDLGAWLPRKRIDAIARFDEKAIPDEARPLLRFWKQELSPSKIATGPNPAGVARLIVDDAVLALWIDGVEVFDRAKGMATSIELKPPKIAVRAWIVSRPQGAANDVVHDTRAVLRAGEIYAVTSTFVQHARGGARRECVRVVGALPFDKDLLWREISNAPSTRPGPMRGADETYRPSVPSAERALTVVPGGDTRPFPPVPLVYSYTHPGLYKWTLAKDGGVKLELVDDESVCPEK